MERWYRPCAEPGCHSTDIEYTSKAATHASAKSLCWFGRKCADAAVAVEEGPFFLSLSSILLLISFLLLFFSSLNNLLSFYRRSQCDRPRLAKQPLSFSFGLSAPLVVRLVRLLASPGAGQTSMLSFFFELMIDSSCTRERLGFQNEKKIKQSKAQQNKTKPQKTKRANKNLITQCPAQSIM